MSKASALQSSCFKVSSVDLARDLFSVLKSYSESKIYWINMFLNRESKEESKKLDWDYHHLKDWTESWIIIVRWYRIQRRVEIQNRSHCKVCRRQMMRSYLLMKKEYVWYVSRIQCSYCSGASMDIVKNAVIPGLRKERKENVQCVVKRLQRIGKWAYHVLILDYN